jgi:hypothetical protein
MIERRFIHPIDMINDRCDRMDNVGELANCGRAIVEFVRIDRKINDFSNEQLLCLGVGQGFPELDFINEAKIPHSNIIFLDKNFSSRAIKRLDLLALDIKRVQKGLFSYLANPDQKFSLITTFGLDYLLDEKAFLYEFFRLVPNAMVDEGLVFVQSWGASSQKSAEKAVTYALEQKNIYKYLFKYNSNLISSRS